MKRLATLLLSIGASAVHAQPAKDSRAEWAGRWRPSDPKLHATLAITDVSPAGFAVEWDEGVGDQGVRDEGTATWTAAGRARFAGAGCKLTLARGADDTLTATVAAESCFNWASPGKVTLVREEAAAAGADCTRAKSPVERAVCADPTLAAAEARVAALQREKLRAHGGGIAAGERRYLDRRAGRCTDEASMRDCVLREQGRRLLELHAWPASPFTPDGRPEVGVLLAILKDDSGRALSGLHELLGGILGGAPTRFVLAFHEDEDGVWLDGCDASEDGGAACARQTYVAFLRNGEIWAASADDRNITIVPAPAKDQALPASLQDFARGPRKSPPR